MCFLTSNYNFYENLEIIYEKILYSGIVSLIKFLYINSNHSTFKKLINLSLLMLYIYFESRYYIIEKIFSEKN